MNTMIDQGYVALLALGATLALFGCRGGFPIESELPPETEIEQVKCAKLSSLHRDYEGTFVRTQGNITLTHMNMSGLYGCNRDSVMVVVGCSGALQSARMQGCLPKDISEPLFSGESDAYDMVVYVHVQEYGNLAYTITEPRLYIETLSPIPPSTSSKDRQSHGRDPNFAELIRHLSPTTYTYAANILRAHGQSHLGASPSPSELMDATLDEFNSWLEDPDYMSETLHKALTTTWSRAEALIRAQASEQPAPLTKMHEPSNLDSALKLAVGLKDRGDYVAAKQEGERVFRLSRRDLGTDHPTTIAAAEHLIHTMRSMGEFEQANLIKKLMSPPHPAATSNDYLKPTSIQQPHQTPQRTPCPTSHHLIPPNEASPHTASLHPNLEGSSPNPTQPHFPNRSLAVRDNGPLTPVGGFSGSDTAAVAWLEHLRSPIGLKPTETPPCRIRQYCARATV